MSYFWKIEEVVTLDGVYIVLPPLFAAHEEQQAYEAARKYPNARAVLYKTGGLSSPERCRPLRVAIG
jgi:hypothetical protein